MGEMQIIGAVADRVMEQLTAGLEREFGRGAGAALAALFLKAEEADWLWDARVEERWLGAFESDGEDGVELDRIAILGRLDGRWFTATLIVDGEGAPHGLMARRDFKGRRGARSAFLVNR